MQKIYRKNEMKWNLTKEKKTEKEREKGLSLV